MTAAPQNAVKKQYGTEGQPWTAIWCFFVAMRELIVFGTLRFSVGIIRISPLLLLCDRL